MLSHSFSSIVAAMQARICGQMYKGGDYGGFWFIAHYGATYFYKNNGTWGKKDL